MGHHMINNKRVEREYQSQVWIDLEGHGERKLNYSFPGRGRRAGEKRFSPLCGYSDFNGLNGKNYIFPYRKRASIYSNPVQKKKSLFFLRFFNGLVW